MQPYGDIAGSMLFLVLLAASLALFAVRLRGVLTVISRSRPVNGWHWRSWPARVRRLVSEVLLQSKVIRERPGPGLAHAFVFWAFCAFALVTANHLAEGVGFPFLRRGSAWSLAYTFFASFFAVACALSIAGLAYRRLVLRPRWLGPVSRESAVIAALIFLLMVTYLPVWWLPPQSPRNSLLWWSHTLVLLAFLPLVPHTKHLHLLLSPFAIFLKRPVFSDIPALSNDDDFGLVSGKNVDQLTSLQAFSCVECGRCTEHCPANNTGKELDPKQIALGVRAYLKSEGPESDKPFLQTTISETALFQCTTCGACEYQCPVGIQHLPIIIGLRRGAVNTGIWDDDLGSKLFTNLERAGNALGLPAADRDRFLSRSELPLFDGSQEYCLWLGCMGAYDPRGREIITSFAAVMRHLGTSFGVLKKERCTGDPVRRLGNDLLFSSLAEENLRTLTNNQVKKIVSICPHCVRTIAQDWQEFGVQVEIEHHSEFLARHQAQLSPTTPPPSKVVYHDPCYLGRYRGSYDQPRAALSTQARVVDPPRSRERGFCCGAGGGLTFLGEETGQRVSHNRAQELTQACADSGATSICTACPFCQSMLRDGLSSLSPAPPELIDIAQLIASRLPAPAAQPTQSPAR